MFGAGRITYSTEVVRVMAQGAILRVGFSGVHTDGIGRQVGDYLGEALKRHEPAAVLLDFSQVKYRFGNDIVGIVQVFVRLGPDGKAATRPSAIVATGRTAESLLSLLEPTGVLDRLGVRVFPDVSSAVEDLRMKLESATA